MTRLLLTAAAAAALMAGVFPAQAACVHRTKTPGTTQPNTSAMKLPPMKFARNERDGTHGIVGLWHVEHRLPDGSLYFESFEQYHSDGTELETANVNPITGNICTGVYTYTDPRTVSLYHIGYIFDGVGNPAGTFTIEGPRTVRKHGTRLEGTFDAKIYDPDGNLVEEDTGTTTGERIVGP